MGVGNANTRSRLVYAQDMQVHARIALWVWLAGAVACGPSAYDRPKDADDPDAVTDGRGAVMPAPIVDTSPPPTAGSEPAVLKEEDAPEISRSVGKPGGAVVLWPRIVLQQGETKPDAATRDQARQVQTKLAELARSAFASRSVDVRPEPERVCPQNGCESVSVGALFAKVGKGCSVVVLTSQPGRSAATPVPWVGRVTLKSPSVPFREHPERHLGFPDLARCDDLARDLEGGKAAIEKALARLAGN